MFKRKNRSAPAGVPAAAAAVRRREGDISSHSGEEALTRARELLRQTRQQLDSFITSRSKPVLYRGPERPSNAQLATMMSGPGDLASHVKAIENAPQGFVNALIAKYRHQMTPAHLRPVWREDRDASGDTPGQMIYTAWHGSPRLYEREIWHWRDMDRDTEMTLRRETICYHWRYDHGEGEGGASTYVEMTVNAEGNAEVSSGGAGPFPATAEGFTALFEAWEGKCAP